MDHQLQALYQCNVNLLEDAGIKWQSWQHEPILDFETDARIAAELGWTATPTKSLFLKLRDGRYCIYLTERDNRLDSKALKQLLGSRPSVCSSETMQQVLGCVPGAVCPFGYDSNVLLVVDTTLFSYDSICWTPGLP